MPGRPTLPGARWGTRTVDLATGEVAAGAVAYRAGDEAVVRVPTVAPRPGACERCWGGWDGWGR